MHCYISVFRTHLIVDVTGAVCAALVRDYDVTHRTLLTVMRNYNYSDEGVEVVVTIHVHYNYKNKLAYKKV